MPPLGLQTLCAYDPAEFASALSELLQVAPQLRTSETYRYDLVDLARQVMANESRRLLPLIEQAYEAKDKITFARLTKEWRRDMLVNDLLPSLSSQATPSQPTSFLSCCNPPSPPNTCIPA